MPEGYGEAAWAVEARQADETEERETEEDKDADEGPLRRPMAGSRNRDRQQTRVLSLRTDDPEDAVVVGVVRRQVPDQHIVRKGVDLSCRGEVGVRCKLHGRGSDLAIPNEREVGGRTDLDVLKELGGEDV